MTGCPVSLIPRASHAVSSFTSSAPFHSRPTISKPYNFSPLLSFKVSISHFLCHLLVQSHNLSSRIVKISLTGLPHPLLTPSNQLAVRILYKSFHVTLPKDPQRKPFLRLLGYQWTSVSSRQGTTRFVLLCFPASSCIKLSLTPWAPPSLDCKPAFLYFQPH